MTRTLRFHLLDVFTDRRFCGNPLAIVEDADALSVEEMRDIAREFNCSETVYLQTPQDPANTARARIFTPQRELPFAGHPTIGAAVLLAESRAPEMLARGGLVIAIEEAIGVLGCELLRGRNGVAYALAPLPTLPQLVEGAPKADELAAALSLDPADIGFGAHVPLRCAAGAPIVFAPLRTRAALHRARREPATFARVAAGAIGVYLYTCETLDPASAVHGRMFAQGLGFDEDPATGSAAAAFAVVAHRFEAPDDGEHQLFIEQGHAMGRPSRITLRMSVAEGRLTGVAIGGQAVRVGEGTLRL